MKSKLFMVLSTLALGACVSAVPDKAPVTEAPVSVGSDKWRAKETVVVVTDASYSMYQHETFADAKAATRSIIASLPAADAKAEKSLYQVGTVEFGGDYVSGMDIGPVDRDALIQDAAQLNLMGFPHPHTPLDEVLAFTGEQIASLDDAGRAAVVVISDGMPDNDKRTIEAASGLATAVPGGVCIHTVQVGSNPNGAALLQNVAKQSNCGSSRNASSLQSASAVDAFTSSVVLAAAPKAPAAPLPPVGAKDACKDTINLGSLNFAFDSDEVSPDGSRVLDVAVGQLSRCPQVRVSIDGHTDWTGPEEYNMGLSDRRADSVMRYLSERGIASDRLQTRGFGEDNPIAPNETREGRSQNRRVELKPGS